MLTLIPGKRARMFAQEKGVKLVEGAELVKVVRV
jgi:hypothetical protein